MSKKRTAAVVAAGLTVGLLVGPVQGALAGHTNALLDAQLNGRNEVAPNGSKRIAGDPNGRGEAYVFGIDNANVGGATPENNTDTICYVIEVAKISGLENNPGAPYAAHIHEGQPGENGPVVVNLAFPTGGEAADCISEDRIGPNGSLLFVRDAMGNQLTTAQEILAHPEDYYVNVHNAEFPNGAVRGQLRGDH